MGGGRPSCTPTKRWEGASKFSHGEGGLGGGVTTSSVVVLKQF